MELLLVSYSHMCWESNIIMGDSLDVGKIFPDDESVKSAVADYNKTHFTSFRISANNKKSIILKCKHGHKRNYDGKGKGPNQTYNFIGCSAQVNLYKSKDDGTLKIRTVDPPSECQYPRGWTVNHRP